MCVVVREVNKMKVIQRLYILRGSLSVVEFIILKSSKYPTDFIDSCVKQREIILKELLKLQLKHFNND